MRIADRLGASGARILSPAVTQTTGSAPGPHTGYSAAQTRVVTAACELFAQHGVGGTSLQMIADALGVTKAAVYHQFRTKDEIVVAAAQTELALLEAAIDVAEAAPTPEEARHALVSAVVDLAVERRRMESTLINDPVIIRFFAHHPPFRDVMDRLYRILTGDGGPGARLPAAMLTAAISGAVVHPLVAELDDDALRAQLLHLARRFLDMPD